MSEVISANSSESVSPPTVEPVTPEKPPGSARKILANRINALSSTGPRTPTGKTHSRRNALKHGLLARETLIGLPDGPERKREFIVFLEALREHFKPVGLVEDLQVQRIATCYWMLALVLRAQFGETLKQREGALDRTAACSDPTHKSVTVVWYGVRYNREQNRMCGIRPRDLTPTEERIIGQLRESPDCILVLQILLGKIREDCRSTGTVSQDNRDLLRDCLGAQADSLLSELSSDAVDSPEQVAKFLEELEAEERSLERLARSFATRRVHHLLRLSIPDERADMLMRYDAHYARELDRAIGELERLQRRRLGEPVPPPIKLDMTGGG